MIQGEYVECWGAVISAGNKTGRTGDAERVGEDKKGQGEAHRELLGCLFWRVLLNQVGRSHLKAGVRFMNLWWNVRDSGCTLICPWRSTSLSKESKIWKINERSLVLKDYRCRDCRDNNSNPRATTSRCFFVRRHIKQTPLQHQSTSIRMDFFVSK